MKPLFLLSLLLLITIFLPLANGFKQTEYMSAAELALRGNLSVGDILESKILVNLGNGTVLELPLHHNSIVVDPQTLEIVHYRFKDENDTTPEERAQAEKGGSLRANRLGNPIEKFVKDLKEQVMRDVRGTSSPSSLRSIRIDCRRLIKNGFMDLIYQYQKGNRKVYRDNMVQSLAEPTRVNNALDARWPPLPATEIVRRALSRIGEEKFDLQKHNCETFVNWARYGQNYTEQGERVGTLVNDAIQNVSTLCQKANSDLIDLVEEKLRYIKRETSQGAMKGAMGGTIFAFGVCVLSAGTMCGPGIVLGSVGAGTLATLSYSFFDAKDEVLRTAPQEIGAKLQGTYKPELVVIFKKIVAELKLEQIVQINDLTEIELKQLKLQEEIERENRRHEENLCSFGCRKINK